MSKEKENTEIMCVLDKINKIIIECEKAKMNFEILKTTKPIMVEEFKDNVHHAKLLEIMYKNGEQDLQLKEQFLKELNTFKKELSDIINKK